MLHGKFNDRADMVARGELQKITKWLGETDNCNFLSVYVEVSADLQNENEVY